MFDIRFFQRSDALKRRITGRGMNHADAPAVIAELEKIRDPSPRVFNVETTNVCNMKCVMCPRTKLMTRSLQTIGQEDFLSVLNQVKPHTEEELAEFWKFVTDSYDISASERSENSFYFYIVSRCLILHGYGEPLLDASLVERVEEASKLGIPTYLSCVPANLTVEKAVRLMEAGLTVLKVSIDSLNDEDQKRIRGPRNNFEKAYSTILEVLEEKQRRGLKTIIAPTMISLTESPEARRIQEDFLRLWDGHDVFAYVKSQDNRWYFEEDENSVNRSHYEKQYCEYPWTSMTVMANGDVVPCTQDYDCEMAIGNIKQQTLQAIWNGEGYRRLREWHVTGNFPAGHKCRERCDQKKLFQYLAEPSTSPSGSSGRMPRENQNLSPSS